MGDKTIYVVAKVFDRQGCLAYRCKTAREARCLPGTLESLRAEGVQIEPRAILGVRALSVHRRHEGIHRPGLGAEPHCVKNFLSREQRLPAAVPWAFSSQTPV